MPTECHPSRLEWERKICFSYEAIIYLDYLCTLGALRVRRLSTKARGVSEEDHRHLLCEDPFFARAFL